MGRLDVELVERGLFESREKAKRAIMAGTVQVNEQTARKPSDPVKPGDRLSLLGPEKFVSRGGLKLEHALDHFKINVEGQQRLTSERPPGALPIVCSNVAPPGCMRWTWARDNLPGNCAAMQRWR